MKLPPRAKAWLKRGFTIAFFSIVLSLLVVNAREIEWAEVWASVKRTPAAALLLAAALAAASHAVYASYDLLSRRYAGHALGTPTVLATTFVSYAFNLNLGSLIGGLGFRHRLYSRLGLDNGAISRIVGFSMTTNWLGYLVLAGTLFLLFPLALPPDWRLATGALRAIGALMLGAGSAYLLMCAFHPRRDWEVRGHRIGLPSLPLAGLQTVVSVVNWMLIGAIAWVLLQRQVPYPIVLSVLLVAAIAGVITHVPAGLGVLEAVFIALLAGQVPKNELLGALLAYRALYYMAPLLIAIPVYLFIEARISRTPVATELASAVPAPGPVSPT